MRLTGFDAISYAERESMTLNKAADSIDDAAEGLTIAEAEAIAVDRPELIWLEVDDALYYGTPDTPEEERGVSHNMEPER